MEKIVEHLSREWATVSEAPASFAMLLALAFSLAYLAARWRYVSQLEHRRAENDSLRERLKLKTEQAEGYKDRALKYDAQVEAVVDSSTTELVAKALETVRQLREYVSRAQERELGLRNTEWADMVDADNEEQKSKLWERYTAASTRLSADLRSEYERRFQVDALLLRDELRSRLNEPQQTDGMVDSMYEHPMGTMSATAVAADLEKLAKTVASASKSLQRTGVDAPAR